jgi:predicted DNA-binding transcriptional regulator YafY
VKRRVGRPSKRSSVGSGAAGAKADTEYQTATNLIDLLRDVESGRPMRLREIEERFGVQTATASKYRDWVEGRVPLVEENEGRSKVWRMKPDADEGAGAIPRAAAVAFAVSALRELEGTDHFAELEVLADQLRLSVPEAIRSRLTRLTRTFQVRNAQRSRHRDRVAVVRALIRGIEERRAATFRYEKRSGEIKSYEVEPWGMLLFHGRLLLVAGRRHPPVEGPNRRRMYDIDGIEEVSLDERERFPEPADRHVDYEDAFRDALSIFSDWHEAPVDIHLQVRGSWAVALRQRSVHHSQQISPAGDGWHDLRLRLCLSPDVVAFVLSMMPRVRVVAPVALKEAAEAAARGFLGPDQCGSDRSMG